MSLSRPIRFPLLKLPFLCIKCVLHNSELFDIIYFATISRRTRRIVKSSNYPLKEIEVSLRKRTIKMGEEEGKIENRKIWFFSNGNYASDSTFVLQRNSHPFRNCRGFEPWRGHYLESYTDDGTLDALKMGMNFLNDVFGCTVREVIVPGNDISELFGLGISSVKVLFILNPGPVNITDLEHLLETTKATDCYIFFVAIPKEFSCDPRIFKCRRLAFICNNAADWVTLEFLCQLDVSELFFLHHRFSAEDIVSYITHWFNSESRKLEHVEFEINNPSLEDFKIEHLNPMSFCEKRRSRCPFAKGWINTDTSSGMDILRQDGLLATLHASPRSILFYVWHKRFPDDVPQ